MANGEWRMANGEWGMANGEWRMAKLLTSKRFHRIAQGCEERATLGSVSPERPTLKGLHHRRGLSPSLLQPLRGCLVFEIPRVARTSQPWAIGWNLFEVGLLRRCHVKIIVK